MSFKEYFLLNEGKSQEKNFCYMLYAEKPYSEYLKEIQDDLDLDGELTEKDEFHITVRYVVTEKDPQPLLDYLNDVELPVLTGTTKNFNIFGDDKCLVMEIDSKEIHNWFKQVNKFIVDSGYPESDYPTYKPHVTLTCGTEKDKPKFDSEHHKLKISFTKHIVTDQNYKVIFERTVR